MWMTEYCGTLSWHKNVIEQIVRLFKISKKEKGTFQYIGLNIEQNGNEIYVDQQPYIDGLKEIQIDSAQKKQLNAKLTEEEKQQLRSACGQILWVTSQTRPDVAFESCQVTNYGNEATVQSIIEVNKTIKKLKSNPLKIVFPNLGDPKEMKIIVYGDASHASLSNGASQGANIVFLSGNEKMAPVSWKSKKLSRITKSPLASEISAVADSADYGHLIASMVKELYALKYLPVIKVCTDSNSLKEHL